MLTNFAFEFGIEFQYEFRWNFITVFCFYISFRTILLNARNPEDSHSLSRFSTVSPFKFLKPVSSSASIFLTVQEESQNSRRKQLTPMKHRKEMQSKEEKRFKPKGEDWSIPWKPEQDEHSRTSSSSSTSMQYGRSSLSICSVICVKWWFGIGLRHQQQHIAIHTTEWKQRRRVITTSDLQITLGWGIWWIHGASLNHNRH